MVERRLLVLYTTTTIITMLYGLITPFLPLLAKDKHISESEVGFIFSSFPFIGLLVSPFVGSFLYKVGRRNTLMLAFGSSSLGFLIAGASTWLYGTAFFLVNCTARGLMGLAFTLMFTTGESYAVIAVIASDYPDNVFEFVGINESMVGLGFLIGPITGAGLYVTLGFEGTFLASSGFYLVAGAVAYVVMGPDREYILKHKDEHILRLGVRPKIFATLLPILYGMMALGAQNMFIAPHLEDNGLDRGWIALVFGITGIGYLVSTFILAKTIEGCNKLLINALGCLIASISMALVGPWPGFFEENIPIILIGFALMPLAIGLLFVEIMPSLIEVATVKLGMENDDKLIDKLSGKAVFSY